MPPMFSNANSSYNKSFAADHITMTFSGGATEAGTLLQNTQFNYSQQVTRLYELAQNKISYAAGRAQGTIGMGRVIGPGSLLQAFYQTYGDVCGAGEHNLTFSPANTCNGPGIGISPHFICKFVVLTGVGINVSANDLVVNEQSQAMFSAMDYSDS